MANIDTNNTNVVTNNDSKNKKELKLEKINKKYELKLEASRQKEIKRLENKKTKLLDKFNKVQNPKTKSSIQDKIDKVDEELKDLKDPAKASVKRPFGLVMKTWSKGLGKEAGRITWYKKGQVLKDFVTVIVVCAFLGLIFFAIDMIIISIR